MKTPPTIVSLFALMLMGVPLEAQAPPTPVPRTDSTGAALTFDFPGMRVGVAEYEEGPTGTTVFYFPKGVKAAADVRGGSPGTLNADAVRLAYESPMMQSVVFSGGSWYGLSAATGVANELKAMRAEQGQHDFIAGVLGAIIFDVGGRRFSRVTPDDRLGAAAVRSAREGWFPQGARGAGRFAMQGIFFLDGPLADASRTWAHSGQGGAFRQIGPTKVAVFTVVNALGAVVNRDGKVLRCRRNVATGDCPAISSLLKDHLERAQRRGGGTGPTGNTTLTLVVTNQKMPYADLQRLGVQVHTSMARAIQPFATEEDGDVLYAVTTDEVDNPKLPSIQLGAIASELAWDAVLNSVPELASPPSRTPTTLSAERRTASVGTFAFHGGGTLSVAAGSSGLEARFTGDGRMYFAADRTYRLIPVAEDLFLVDGTAEDVIRFDRRAGRIVALTLNPGPWSQSANRVPTTRE